MKTIYSILYVALNTALDERVSIGVLLSDSEHDIFKYSSEKLLALKSLMDPERYSLMKNYLKALEDNVNFNTADLSEAKPFNREWINESYISYLSRYSNNLIQFSEPRSIDIEFGFENFKRIFEKYVYAYEARAENTQETHIYVKVKEKLYPKISDRVNLDIVLDASHFENLFAPIEVNFIGINGMAVAGQAIDFSKRHYNLENDVARFVSLTKAIELGERKNGQYFVLGREPENTSHKNHLLWEQIRDSDFLEFVDIDEIGIVEDYIENNDVRPYFEK